MAGVQKVQVKASAIKVSRKPVKIVLPQKQERTEEKRTKTLFRQQLGHQTQRNTAIEERIEEIFDSFDLNKDGKISLEELKQGLLRWGIKLNKYNLDLLVKSFEGAEGSNIEQFRVIMKFFIKIRQSFTKFDKDSSNTISIKELNGFLSVFDYGFDSDFIRKFLSFFDTDHSGELDWQETVELMLYVNYLHELFKKEDHEKGILAPPELQSLLRVLNMNVSVKETELFLSRISVDAKVGMNFEKFVELLLDMKENLESLRKDAAAERKNKRVPRNVDQIERKLPVTSSYKEHLEKHLAEVDKILQKCRASGKKFEDPEFTTDDVYVFPKRHDALWVVRQWKRMEDFGPEAELFKDGIDQGDIKQGALGDCWFLSSLCVLAGNGTDTLKNLFLTCYPKEGVIQCRFFKDGEWVFVVTDDRIPCGDNGKPCFACCRDKNELWVPVMEKCYAKLHGSYEAIESGSIADGLVDLTGEASEFLDIRKDAAFWELLLNNIKEGYLMGCAAQTAGASVEEMTPQGILMLHAYGILNVIEIEGFKLLKIRNPWGKYEWTGRWSDGSKEWTPSLQKALNVVFEDDGTFYMEYSDFCKHFNKLYVLRMLTDEIGTQWRRVDLFGEWVGETAGGCLNNPTWVKNPQIHIKAEEDTRFFISVRQPDLRMKLREKPKYTKPVGFAVLLKGDVSEQPKTRLAGKTDLIVMAPFFSGREISLEFNAKANVDYVIVPSHFNPGEENKFHIIIYSLSQKSLVRMLQQSAIAAATATPNLQAPGQPAQLQQAPSAGGPEQILAVQSAWIKGKTAGGCPNEPTWKESPQFILDLPVDNNVSIKTRQLQKGSDGKYYHMGFFVMKAEPAKKRKFQTTDIVFKSQFINSPETSSDVILPQGTYNILVCTFQANQENTFELSVKGKNLQRASLYEITPTLDWKKATLEGSWSPGQDGGCSNNKDTWMQNPMFGLELGEKSTVKIVLDVLDVKTPIGYYVFQTKDGKKVSKMIGPSPFAQIGAFKHVSTVKDWELEAGKYLVMPATFEAKHHAKFVLGVYSEVVPKLSIVV